MPCLLFSDAEWRVARNFASGSSLGPLPGFVVWAVSLRSIELRKIYSATKVSGSSFVSFKGTAGLSHQ